MHTKPVISHLCAGPIPLRHTALTSRQRGVSLIELMIGIAIGLLVVAVASGALMVSRGVSSTVSDASILQQQASYAYRVIGQQLRQSGSLYLNLNVSNNADNKIDQYALPVAFETAATSSQQAYAFSPKTDSLSGTDNSLQIAYRRYKELVFKKKASDPAKQSLSRDCQGGPTDSDDAENNSFMRIQSSFSLKGSSLMCAGLTGDATAMLNNVANFQVRYIQVTDSGSGSPKIKYVNTAGVGGNWDQVTGVEVCLVLYGSERMDMPTGTSYKDCDGSSVDMSQNALGADRAQRMHMVFRNVYQLRSHGLLDKVL